MGSALCKKVCPAGKKRNQQQIVATSSNQQQPRVTSSNQHQARATSSNREQAAATKSNERQVASTSSNREQAAATKSNEQQARDCCSYTKEMESTPTATRKTMLADLPTEILKKIFSSLPASGWKDVALVCKGWRDMARSLHISLGVIIKLAGDFQNQTGLNSEELRNYLKKTRRLKMLQIRVAVNSEEDINFSSIFDAISAFQSMETQLWNEHCAPTTLSTFELTIANINKHGGDILFYGISLRLRNLSRMLNFQLEKVLFGCQEMHAVFQRSGINGKQGLRCLVVDKAKGEIETFLENCGDDVQEITLRLRPDDLNSTCENFFESVNNMSTLQTLTLEAYECECPALKLLFNTGSKLNQLSNLNLSVPLDTEIVRNIGNCCGKYLRSLTLNVVCDMPVCADHDEWVEHLKKFKSLKLCRLAGFHMSSESWASLFDHESGLNTLLLLCISLPTGTLHADTFLNIAKYCGANLGILSLKIREGIIGEDSAKHIRNLSALKVLSLYLAEGSDSSDLFNHLFSKESQLNKLEMFNLSGTTVGNLDENSVANMVKLCSQTLENLELTANDSFNGYVNHLKHLSKLTTFSMVGPLSKVQVPGAEAVSSAAWSSLFDGSSELKNLSKVELRCLVNVDDDCLKNLSQLCGQKLQYLDVRECTKVTDDGINTVKKMCHPEEMHWTANLIHIPLDANQLQMLRSVFNF